MSNAINTKEEIIREEIIITAQRLFQRYGFGKTTMEDIAKAMGKGKSTLYYYYKSKDEIFDAVTITEATEVLNSVHTAIDNVNTAEEKLQIYLHTMLNAVKGKFNLYALLKEEIFDGHNECSNCPPLNKAISLFNTQEMEFVKSILIMGIENKEFNQNLKDNVDLVAYVVITALRSIVVDLAFSDKMNGFFEGDKVNTMSSILIKGLK